MVKYRRSFTFSMEFNDLLDKKYNELKSIEKRFFGYRNITSKSQFVEVALKRELDKL